MINIKLANNNKIYKFDQRLLKVHIHILNMMIGKSGYKKHIPAKEDSFINCRTG